MKRDSFPKNGTKKEQIRWFAEKGDIEGTKAIAFCVDSNPNYVREVLN